MPGVSQPSVMFIPIFEPGVFYPGVYVDDYWAWLMGARISVSSLTIASTASIGDTIGTLSVVGGTGVYTFTLTNNPGGLFSIAGTSLKVAAALSPGSDPITIKADNGAGSVILLPTFVVVTASGTQGSPIGILLSLTKAA